MHCALRPLLRETLILSDGHCAACLRHNAGWPTRARGRSGRSGGCRDSGAAVWQTPRRGLQELASVLLLQHGC